MTWMLALATILLLSSMALACHRSAREAAEHLDPPVPDLALDRLLADAGLRRVVGVGREVLLAEASTARVLSRRRPVPRTPGFQPAARPGACAR